jgi:hypothetical protein
MIEIIKYKNSKISEVKFLRINILQDNKFQRQRCEFFSPQTFVKKIALTDPESCFKIKSKKKQLCVTF